jgi:hypothetical protein
VQLCNGSARGVVGEGDRQAVTGAVLTSRVEIMALLSWHRIRLQGGQGCMCMFNSVLRLLVHNKQAVRNRQAVVCCAVSQWIVEIVPRPCKSSSCYMPLTVTVTRGKLRVIVCLCCAGV